MLHTLQKGDKVKVWPRPGLRVKIGPDVMANGKMLETRLLADEGEEVSWSEWFHDLAKGGALYFSDPHAGGKVRQAQHVRHPHECGADGRAAIDGGAAHDAELAHWKALGHTGAKLKPVEKPAGKE